MRARRSVNEAKARPHPWAEVSVFLVDDSAGSKGRSAARNEGMQGAVGWLFFLDADDQMMPDALSSNSFEHDATFGRVCIRGNAPNRNDIFPLTKARILTDGPVGTLSMGFFIRAEVAQSVRFDESLDIGEDFEFYRRLIDRYTWTKIDSALVRIGYLDPSATGPRRAVGNWSEECRKYLS